MMNAISDTHELTVYHWLLLQWLKKKKGKRKDIKSPRKKTDMEFRNHI